jgi:hypothetical protein
MKVYITHCCAKKDDTLRGTGKRVTPDKLYSARPTKRFMEVCKNRSVIWAILSDEFGVWFSDVEHEWYEKDPNSIKEEEFIRLLHDFDAKLERFDEIWFYYNPGRFHSIYARLLEKTKLWDRIRRFTHVTQIGQRGPEMNKRSVKGMKQEDSPVDCGGAKVGLTGAARILNELQTCKAYGPRGKINGPNCQRFGHRDDRTGHWYWDVRQLISEAQRRNSAPPEVIQCVRQRYSAHDPGGVALEPKPRSLKRPVAASRADVEKDFRDTLVYVERALRERMPWTQAGRDRRTLGNLVHEAEEKRLLAGVKLQEAWLVNTVRNTLNHPTTEEITDEDVTRASESARAIIDALEVR